MGKRLVIAEKPSVAADIARVLGRLKKEGDYFENDEWVVSSAIGHLVELCLPSDMEVKRGKWSFANLPIIPEGFELRPIEKTESRFKLLKRLMNRKDVTEVINACDAGREGELIFRYLTKLAGLKKPIRRLWLQSMTPDAIREAFQKLREDEEMIPLSDAAMSRSESDWLVGINSTRALTAFNSKAGGFQKTTAGRVQTPTLAILVEREEKIRGFKERTYWEVFGDFAVQAGSYRGRWFDEKFAKTGDEDARAERIWEIARAEEIQRKCQGKTGIVTEEKKAATQAAPLLYDLTTLQREANGRFGFSARRTLQLAQQLYERHKVLTYPRTDSRYLPEDNLAQVRKVMGTFADPALAGHARKALDNGWVKPTKRVFNNAKVTDHNAIIPTGEPPKNLDEAQQKLFDLVAKRFIAVFYPAAQFEVTTRITRVEGEAFKTDGKIITDPGWLAVYGREAAGEGDDQQIVPISTGERAKAETIELKECKTRPPARLNEATLLSAMEGAGKLVEDDELREAMSEKGLGTPATRASIIEGLIFENYVERRGRELIATAKGVDLIKLLRAIGVNALYSPELTGEWEHKLKQIEHGKLNRAGFMNQIRGFTADIVQKVKGFGDKPIEGDYATLDIPCPKCGAMPIREDYKTFRCAACDFVIWKTMASRQFELSEIETLLRERRLGPLEGFRSKMGRPFAASVKIGDDFKVAFEFENNGAQADGEAPDLSALTPLVPCPVCKQGNVYDVGNAYQCDRALNKQGCTLRVGKVILQQEISPEQAVKLFTIGRTDLLTRFISKKNNRAFSAFLKLDGDKVAFEFAPREKKAPAKSRKPAAAKA
jgi:DNA topoisomerase-3